MSLTKNLALLGVFFVFQGCRISQEVPVEGRIESASGKFDCAAGQVCEIDVEDGADFKESFTAIANSGFRFLKWAPTIPGEKASLCAGSSEACELDASGLLTSYDFDTYLMPVFEVDAEWNYWKHADVKTLDSWGEQSDSHADLVALYEKEDSGRVVLRVDYMDLTSAAVAPTYIGLDFKPGGVNNIIEGKNTPRLDIAWDLLIIAANGGAAVYDSSFREVTGAAKELIIDQHLDYLSLKLDRAHLQGWTGGTFSLQAITTNSARTATVDATAVGKTSDTVGRGKLVIVNNTAILPNAPYKVNTYDGYEWRPEERPGVRRGIKSYLDAAETYGIPVTLADVRSDTLAGWEYLGVNDRFREMSNKGLLNLLSNTTYGQFMPWWPDFANQMAIDLTKAAKAKMNIPETNLFWPYESMMRVRDIELIKNAGYQAIYAYKVYEYWFGGITDWGDKAFIKSYVNTGRKIHRVNGMDVIFDPQGFAFGFDADSRWADDDLSQYSWAWMTRGTDQGLHSWYRRTLLDLALDTDQQQFTGAGGDDLAFTEWIFPDVADWNFKWLASHPWIEVTTFDDILSRGWDVIDHGTLPLGPDENMMQRTDHNNSHYNAYFPQHYHGGIADGHSSRIAAGVEIESLYDYIPYLRDGIHIPSGRIFGDYKTPGSIVYETLENLKTAPDNKLRELAWFMFFQTTGEVTFHWEGKLLPSSKATANMVGHVNKIVAAANWAEDVRQGKLSEQSVVLVQDLDLDGEDEFIIHNNEVYAVFENDGGRVEYAFAWDAGTGPIQLIGPYAQSNRPFGYDNFHTIGEVNFLIGGSNGAGFFDKLAATGEPIVEAMAATTGDKFIEFQTADGRIRKRYTLAGDELSAAYVLADASALISSSCFVTNMAAKLELDWSSSFELLQENNFTGWQTSKGGYAGLNIGNLEPLSFLDSPAGDEMYERENKEGYPHGHWYPFPYGCVSTWVGGPEFEASITLRASNTRG